MVPAGMQPRAAGAPRTAAQTGGPQALPPAALLGRVLEPLASSRHRLRRFADGARRGRAGPGFGTHALDTGRPGPRERPHRARERGGYTLPACLLLRLSRGLPVVTEATATARMAARNG